MGAQSTENIHRSTALGMFNKTMTMIKEKRHRDMEEQCDENYGNEKTPREFCLAFCITYKWVFTMVPDQISNRDLEDIVSLPYFRESSCRNYSILPDGADLYERQDDF